MNKRVRKIIQYKASKAYSKARNPVYDIDDFLQDGAVAMLSAMDEFDNSFGSVEAYANAVLNNFYIKSIEKIIREHSFIDRRKSSDAVVCCKKSGPYQSLREKEFRVLVEKFEEKLKNILPRNALEVYNNLFIPDEKGYSDFIIDGCYRDNIGEVASRLNIDENKVSYNVLIIKQKVTELAQEKEFEDIFGSWVRSKAWPLVKFCNSFESANKLAKKYCLDLNTLREKISRKNEKYYLFISKYKWGCILDSRNFNQEKLLLIVGRINYKKGHITGKIGTKMNIPIPWYMKMVRSFRKDV